MQKPRAFEAGYVSGVATSLEKALVQVVHDQMVLLVKHRVFFNSLSQQLVEDTLNELLPLLSDGDIVIDHGNSNFKNSRRERRLVNLVSNLLIAVLAVEFFGLEAWILSYGWWYKYSSICTCRPF